MKNLGITDGIVQVLAKAGKPMKPCHVARKLPLPPEWTYAKLRRNVASIMVHELRLHQYGRWRRTEKGWYVLNEQDTWVREGLIIRHQQTGAVVKVVGKLKRNGVRTTTHRWLVTKPGSGRTWPVRGEDLEHYWEPVKSG